MSLTHMVLAAATPWSKLAGLQVTQFQKHLHAACITNPKEKPDRKTAKANRSKLMADLKRLGA